MSRLGELLIELGVLDADKLEQALRAQVVWGGRLGTNLIELGFIDLDELSRALGKLHGVPAALARHFEKADPVLQRRILPELADKHSFVPLVELADEQVAIACMDPPDDDALAEIAHELGISSANVIVSVAAEQRMRYQLERVYNIARSARYLRSRGKSIPPFPEFGDFSTEPDSEVEIPIEWDVPVPARAPEPMPVPPVVVSPERSGSAGPRSAPEGERAVSIERSGSAGPRSAPEGERAVSIERPPTQPDALAALIDRAIAAAPPAEEQGGRERRSYVKTLADDSSPPALPPLFGKASPPPVPETAPGANTLGRIAIRKVAVGAAGAREVGLPDAAKAIRRALHRDRVAELVLDSIEHFVPECSAAALLVVRGDTATTWCHFTRSAASLPDVAVAIDAPGLVPRALESASTARAPSEQLNAPDRRLLHALGADDDGELAIVPIAIGGKSLCVIACAVPTDTAIGDIETIATSAGTAFARLMRAAAR